MLDIELERRFFQEFLPDAVHPKTGAPIHLHKYQGDALSRLFTHQRNLWEWGRQTGKTSSVALYLTFMSREIRGDIIIVSFKHERAKEIVKWVRDWCYAHKDPAYSENIELDAQTHLHFKNGVRIIALPHGESARGYAARIIVMDESQLVPDNDLAAILPTGAATAAKQIFMGTVYGTSGFWWRWIQSAETYHYALSQIRSSDAVTPVGPILQPELDILKLTLGDAFYNQECDLIPIPDIDVFYGSEWVKGILGNRTTIVPNCEVICGFDHAVSGRDESIAFIGCLFPDGKFVEHEVRAWHNTLIHDQVHELATMYPQIRYCIDATAEGGKEALGYFQRAGLDVSGVDFGKSKMRLMVNLKNTGNEHLIMIEDERTRIQLSNYKFKESETAKGKYKFGEPGTPDDRVDALALACWRASELRGHGEFMVGFGEDDRKRVSESAGLFS